MASDLIRSFLQGVIHKQRSHEGEGRGLTYLVKLIKERRGRGSKNAPFAWILLYMTPRPQKNYECPVKTSLERRGYNLTQ